VEGHRDQGDERRALLLGTAVAGLTLLASLAEEEGLEEVRGAFLDVAHAWASEVSLLRLLEQAMDKP
jgi:hypothetical protein